MRNEPQIPDVGFACRVCGRVCKSKGGLVNHRRCMHEESSAKKIFTCGECSKEFKKESSLLNHAKVCGGAVAAAVGKTRCVCGKEYAKSYFRKHRSKCDAWKDAHPEPEVEVTPPRVPRAACDECGRWMRKDNLARQLREACPGGEAGP